MKKIIMGVMALFLAMTQVQTLKAETLTMVVPFASGGTTDVVARTIAQQMRNQHNINVVVENRPGASGSIGANHVISQEPNGLTVLFTSNGIVANRHFSNVSSVDVIQRLTPVASVVESGMVLLVDKNLNVNNVTQLIEMLRSRPDFYHYGTSSGGGTLQLAASLFLTHSNTQMVAVPYSGGSTALTDLIAGRIVMMFDSTIVGIPHHINGGVRALAVTTPYRSRLDNTIPTLRESGVDVEFTSWQGVFVSKETPIEIQQRLNHLFNSTLQNRDTNERLMNLGVDRIPNENLQQLQNRVEQEIRLWNQVFNR